MIWDTMTQMVVLLIYTFPFAMIGVYYLVDRQIIPRVQRVRGRILIKQLQSNGRFKTFYGLPEVETVTDKEFDPVTGKEKEVTYTGYFIKKGDMRLPFIQSSDALYDDFNTKVAYYDTEGNQILINELKRVMPSIAPKMIDSLTQRIWNAGRAAAFGEKKNLFLFVVIGAGAAIFACLLIVGIYQYLDKIIATCAG